MKIVGVDPEGSVYTAKSDGDLHPYLVEGIGKDTWPETMDPDVVDEWIRVSDRDSFLAARRLAREEGLLVGGSSGSTIAGALVYAKRLGPDARVLTILPDSGRSYLSKFLDDNWMIEHGFLERSRAGADACASCCARSARRARPRWSRSRRTRRSAEAIAVMEQYSISQLPVVRDGELSSLARRDRLAAGPRPARPRVQERGRAARGRRRRDAAPLTTVEADAVGRRDRDAR